MKAHVRSNRPPSSFANPVGKSKKWRWVGDEREKKKEDHLKKYKS